MIREALGDSEEEKEVIESVTDFKELFMLSLIHISNGSASAIAKSVFDALGAETYVINNEPNGTNINMEAGSTHIEVLQKYVKDNKLDIGFAYDGDADRCLCIDDKGNIVDGDLILYVCGVYMKQNGELDNNTVVTTIMSNIGLYKAFDAVGIDYAKTDVCLSLIHISNYKYKRN